MEKLLFEIGTEEIPAKFMPGILKQLKELAAAKMQELRIPFEDITVYGTPRRMAFIAGGVAETQADVVVEAKGPSVRAKRHRALPADRAWMLTTLLYATITFTLLNIWQVSRLSTSCRVF